jgi:hypothetical protein
MAYNPDDPDSATPAVLFLVEAIGPPSDELLEKFRNCDFGFRHLLQIFTGGKKQGAIGRTAQYSVYVSALLLLSFDVHLSDPQSSSAPNRLARI